VQPTVIRSFRLPLRLMFDLGFVLLSSDEKIEFNPDDRRPTVAMFM